MTDTNTPKFETQTERRRRRIRERIERRGQNKRGPEQVVAAREERARNRRVSKIFKRIRQAANAAAGQLVPTTKPDAPPRKAKSLSTHAEKRAIRMALRASRNAAFTAGFPEAPNS